MLSYKKILKKKKKILIKQLKNQKKVKKNFLNKECQQKKNQNKLNNFRMKKKNY